MPRVSYTKYLLNPLSLETVLHTLLHTKNVEIISYDGQNDVTYIPISAIL